MGKVTAKGLGVLRPHEQVETLINTLSKMEAVLMTATDGFGIKN